MCLTEVKHFHKSPCAFSSNEAPFIETASASARISLIIFTTIALKQFFLVREKRINRSFSNVCDFSDLVHRRRFIPKKGK